MGEEILQPASFFLDSFSAAHLNLSCLWYLVFFAFSVSYGAVYYGGYFHGITALIKGIRSLAPKAFKTTKLSPVILPRGVMIVVTDFIAEVGIKCRMVKKSPVKAVTSFELTVK